MAVVRKIELAGAAGNGAAMFDGVEKIRVAQLLCERDAGRIQVTAQFG